MAARAGRAVRLNNHFEARQMFWQGSAWFALFGRTLLAQRAHRRQSRPEPARYQSLCLRERAHIVAGLLFVQLVAL